MPEAPGDGDDATEVAEPDDPESAPAIPAAAVAGHAAALRRADAIATDREIWRLAWPVILSQILASAVSLVDIAMLGRLGSASLAAVGYVTQIFLLSQAVLFAIGVAGVALMSRAIGAGDHARARTTLVGCLAISIVVAAILAGAVLAAPRALLGLLNAKPDVIETALPYLRFSMAATLLFAVSITLECGFRAMRDTRTPLAVAVVVTAVKTATNYLLIFGPFGLPKLGLAGAGIATLVAQTVAVLLLASSMKVAARRWLATRDDGVAEDRAGRELMTSPLADGSLRGTTESRGGLRERARDRLPSRAILRDVGRIAAPAVLERLVLNLALLDYFRMLGDYGSSAIAAYTVGVRMMSFSWIPGIGFAAAAATMVGHELGAADPHAAVRAGWRAARFAVGVSILLGLVFGFGRGPLARVFTNDAGVLAELGPFMLTLALTQPLLGLHFTLSGALRGAGDTVSPLLAAAIGNWAFRVPLAWAFSHAGLPILWMWVALVFDHVARVAIVGVVFARGRWHRKQPPAEHAAQRR
jgi:Na+-driven multidrug efflux pump